MTKKPTLHIIGLHHTICDTRFDHCAFTGKVRRFSPMMQMYGYHTVEYSNGESMSNASEQIQILTEKELFDLLPGPAVERMGPNSIAYGKNWAEFNKRLIERLGERVRNGDIVCHPFGPVHDTVPDLFPNAFHVETGIGYHAEDFCKFRIFESYAVMHYLQGRQKMPDGKNGRIGRDYEWVIPNYYDVSEWEQNDKHGDYLVYFGRITEDKGLHIVREIAAHQDIPVKVYGLGDPSQFMGPNMEYLGSVEGTKNKSEILRGARAILMPTRYIEPFGGSGVEAMLCGTPVLSSDFGCFAETVEHGKTGYRCHTLGDWLEAVKAVDRLDRKYISERARSLYGYEPVGAKYNAAFMQIVELSDKGWYSKRSWTPGIDLSPVLDKETYGVEKEFWGKCLNTTLEEAKQIEYALRMGLVVKPNWAIAHPEGKTNLRILDIGGGPASMLLKFSGLGRGCVVDPIEYPEWTRERYASKHIDVILGRGEDIFDINCWDEVWIYNCLQHVENPKKIIENARRAASVIRLFEWIDMEPWEGHPQKLTQADLESWLGKPGETKHFNTNLHWGDVDLNILWGKAFFGVFPGRII